MPKNTPEETEETLAAGSLSAALKRRDNRDFSTKVRDWLGDQVPLVEAVLLAVSIHVVAFPVIWFVGWALPWPKPPVVTTIIEWDLTGWPNHPPVPKKVLDIREPRFNP